MAVTLYTSRIVLEMLGIEDYGIYNIVGGVVVMLGILNTAMSSATQRFLSFELGRKDDEQLKKVFSSSLLIHAIIAFFIFIVAETVGLWFLNTELSISPDRMVAANWVYQFSIFTFMVNVMSVPYNAAIISHEQMNIYAYVSIVEVILKLAVVYFLSLLGFDKLIVYAFLIFVISLLIRVVYQCVCKNKFQECTFSPVWDRGLLKKMISFSGWSLFGGGAYIAKSQGVNVVLNVLYGATINAAWGISQQVNAAVLSFIQSFTTALNPPIVKAYAAKNSESLFSLLFEGMKFTFFLSYCFVIPLLFDTEYVLSLWLKNVPEYSVDLIKYMLVIVLIDSFANAIGTTIQATGRIKWYQIIVGGVLFLNFPLSYAILQIIPDPVSTMYVAVLLSVLSMVLRFWILHRLVPYPMAYLVKLFRLIGLLGLLTLPVLFCCQYWLSGFLRLILISFVNLIISLFVLFFIGMSGMQRKKVYQHICAYIKKMNKE